MEGARSVSSTPPLPAVLSHLRGEAKRERRRGEGARVEQPEKGKIAAAALSLQVERGRESGAIGRCAGSQG
uniref:Uncharacterized protein n=1 Tax=Oryza sativa subsp. japonica TaxID=39947 RepID=Q69ML1_ORYSJ|nr:hypothetical protein [Oryza sativa Japonica Group]